MSAVDDSPSRTRIATDLEVAMFVEAGAGTGKTHELVGRLVALVASGVARPRGLVAITFTEAAAAEMRLRLRQALERAASDPELSPDERERCAEALDHLDAAAVTTLHGFAHRLLSSHPSEAGVPADFEVVDEIQAEVAFSDRWARFLADLLEGGSDGGRGRAVVARLLALGGRLANIREIARGLHADWDRLLGYVPESEELLPVDAGDLLAAVDGVVSAARATQDGGKLAARASAEMGPFAERLRRAVAGPSDAGVLALVVNEMPEVKVGGRPTAGAAGVREALDAALDARDHLVGELAANALALLMAPLARFALDAAEDRRVHGALEYHDLLVRAVLLLRDHADVREELSRGIATLVIDEFQDTDPLQAEMVSLLAVPRLCLVGDPKQSIYRFRRADFTVYEGARERFGGAAVTLSSNHRSVPGVLAWVNAAFAELMRAEAGSQPAFAPLAPVRSGTPGEAGVLGLGGPHDEGRVAELRRIEAEQMAALALELREGERRVAASDGSTRSLRLDDIAVLLPTRSALPALEKSLEEAGIPYRIESRSLVFSTDEVHDVLAVLDALGEPGEAPGDEIAVVSALRGLGFACSDVHLLEWRTAGGRWTYPAELPPGIAQEHPVAAALGHLERLHAEAVGLPVNLLVDRVIRECRLVELAAVGRRPRDRWRRYRLLLDEARAFVEGGGTRLGDFVGWIARQAEEGATRVEAVADEPDDEAVRILTVHGAKGLEFPVVMLAGLNATPPPASPLLIWSSGSPELRVGLMGAGLRTPGYQAALEAERHQDEAERCRLLYVAATRARDLLVVGLHHKRGARCPARDLVELDEASPLPWERRSEVVRVLVGEEA